MIIIDKQDKIISLLKEQNKRLAALQRIESDNNSCLNSFIYGGYGDGEHSLDEWGHLPYSDSDF